MGKKPFPKEGPFPSCLLPEFENEFFCKNLSYKNDVVLSETEPVLATHVWLGGKQQIQNGYLYKYNI